MTKKGTCPRLPHVVNIGRGIVRHITHLLATETVPVGAGRRQPGNRSGGLISGAEGPGRGLDGDLVVTLIVRSRQAIALHPADEPTLRAGAIIHRAGLAVINRDSLQVGSPAKPALIPAIATGLQEKLSCFQSTNWCLSPSISLSPINICTYSNTNIRSTNRPWACATPPYCSRRMRSN